jgi:hypothetical protein
MSMLGSCRPGLYSNFALAKNLAAVGRQQEAYLAQE